MKIPRFSISGLMAVVLLVALDFGAFEALQQPSLFPPGLSDLIVFGALPMANLLAFRALLGRRSAPGWKLPPLVGFDGFGLAGLLLFLVGSTLAPHAIHEGVGEVPRSLRLQPGPLFAATASVFLLLPQLALAWLGGWLGGRFDFRVGVAVTRRPGGGSERPPGEAGRAIAPGGLPRVGPELTRRAPGAR